MAAKPLTIGAVRVALADEKGNVQSGTSRQVLFSGKPTASVPGGVAVPERSNRSAGKRAIQLVDQHLRARRHWSVYLPRNRTADRVRVGRR
jgi:hypothetical protein